MVNPAFMTRQIAEIAEKANGVRIHITSNNPIRPANKPEDWEAVALERFEHGLKESIAFVPGNEPMHRYMAPLRVEAPCMNCHSKQGYQIGQIRGGISVTMPAGELVQIRDADRFRSAVGHALVFAVLAGLLYVLMTRSRAHMLEMSRINAEQEQTIEERTRSLSLANARLEEELGQREVAATVFSHMAEAILVVNAQGFIVEVNPAFSRVTGYSVAEVLGKDFRFLTSREDGTDFLAVMFKTLFAEGSWQGEVVSRRKNGEQFVSWLSVTSVGASGRQDRFVAMLSDISARKQMEEQLRHLAHFDTLTDLPNRALFADRLQVAVTQSQRHTRQFALCYLDLDYFKAVNDSLGHSAGDLLLVDAAARLQSCVRQSDTVARLGGDEFALILTEFSSVEEVLEVAKRIVHALALPFDLGVGEGRISASIGIAIYPDHGSEAEALKINADAALYSVKERGRNGYQLFCAHSG
jgi:diguanylate cyclase (GGDEF)-like protein/PAS domain S-box-containing protein